MASVRCRRVAVVATDGVEQAELIEPVKALKQAGADVLVIAPHPGQIQGMVRDEKGEQINVDHELCGIRPESFDALVLPGGVANPDKLRVMPEVVAFVRHFVTAHKPIAAICHGPWTLIEAGGVKGRKMTSWPSLQTDLCNAGAEWVDQKVVVDDMLVTSRKPEDLPDFCRELMDLIGRERPRHAA
jgi:protease I